MLSSGFNLFFFKRKCALSWNWWRQHWSTSIDARLHGFLFCQVAVSTDFHVLKVRIDLSLYYLDAGLKRYEAKKYWCRKLQTHESQNGVRISGLSCTTICMQTVCNKVDTKSFNQNPSLIKFWLTSVAHWACLPSKALITKEVREIESVYKQLHSIVNKKDLQHVGCVWSGQQRKVHR